MSIYSSNHQCCAQEMGRSRVCTQFKWDLYYRSTKIPKIPQTRLGQTTPATRPPAHLARPVSARRSWRSRSARLGLGPVTRPHHRGGWKDPPASWRVDAAGTLEDDGKWLEKSQDPKREGLFKLGVIWCVYIYIYIYVCVGGYIISYHIYIYVCVCVYVCIIYIYILIHLVSWN